MKKIAIVVILCTIRVAAGAPAASSPDCLWPVDLNFDKEYRQRLEAKLCVTPADCGRIVEMPSFSGDGVAAVYSRPLASPDGRLEYYVTCTRSVLVSDAGADPEKWEVRRLDAAVPEAAAVAVKKALLTLLRIPCPKATENLSISVDETMFEVAVLEPNKPPLYGALPDEPGKNAKALVLLGSKLFSYCEAAPEERPHIAKGIQIEAEELTNNLE